MGVIFDTQLVKIYIPERRLTKAKAMALELLSDVTIHRKVKVRKLASFVGKVISMNIVLDSFSQIMTRYLSMDILKAQSWESCVIVSSEGLGQLHFWKHNLEFGIGMKFFESLKFSKVVYSDASNTGYAGYEVKTLNGVAHGMWSEEEKIMSSTATELLALFWVLQSLSSYLAKSVKWFTDNKRVESVVKKGSMKGELQDIAINILKFCLSFNKIRYRMDSQVR